MRRGTGSGPQDAGPPRVGIFGFVGSGNLGNDAAFEVILAYLRRAHPEVAVDAMCMGPERLQECYDIPARPMLWYKHYEGRFPRPAELALKIVGKGVSIAGTAAWVRRHDVVIVPGAGALEATLPLRASGYPLAIFTLCSAGRLFGTKVALVSVGANPIRQRVTRWMQTTGARRAFYRSYRDQESWDAMRQRGLDVSSDPVYPDLVFGQPSRPFEASDPSAVGVGLMAYFGGNDDRYRSVELHNRYVETMTRFVSWLVEQDRPVRLFWGDSHPDIDRPVVERVMTEVRRAHPDLTENALTATSLDSPSDLMAGLAEVGTFVGTRYHNVVSALRLSKPTISIGYSKKFEVLMADMGLAGFCQAADSVDFDELTRQFAELDRRRVELARGLIDRNRVISGLLDQQFSELSARLFPPAYGSEPARSLVRQAEAYVR